MDAVYDDVGHDDDEDEDDGALVVPGGGARKDQLVVVDIVGEGDAWNAALSKRTKRSSRVDNDSSHTMGPLDSESFSPLSSLSLSDESRGTRKRLLVRTPSPLDFWRAWEGLMFSPSFFSLFFFFFFFCQDEGNLSGKKRVLPMRKSVQNRPVLYAEYVFFFFSFSPFPPPSS